MLLNHCGWLIHQRVAVSLLESCVLVESLEGHGALDAALR